MRGILINPYLSQVTEVDVSTLADYYRVMSWLDHPVRTLTIGDYRMGNNDVLYVDNEFLLSSGNMAWQIGLKIFANCGLLLGSKMDGYDCDAKSLLTTIQSDVIFGIGVTQ